MTRRLLAISFVIAVLVVAWPTDALAQRGRGGRGPVVVLSPQRTVVYPPWYGPFGGGFGYPYGYGYPSPYPYPYRGYYNDNAAGLRIDAKPRETEVYVDGARAGIVDDFDGIFQRLHLTPGQHEITLYLAGYRTWSENRYFGPRSDSKILHTMLQLAPGQPDEPRPVPPPVIDRRQPNDDGRYPDSDRPMSGDDRRPLRPRPLPPPDQPRNPPPPDQPRNPPPPDQPRTPDLPDRPSASMARNFGTLSVGIQTPDAEVILDGQKQTLPKGQARLVIQLAEGVHRLTIQKSGLSTFETDLQIRRGRTLSFDVSLVK